MVGVGACAHVQRLGARRQSVSRFQFIASCCCVALGSSLTSLRLHFLISEQTREPTLYCTWLLRERGRFAEASPPRPPPHPTSPCGVGKGRLILGAASSHRSPRPGARSGMGSPVSVRLRLRPGWGLASCPINPPTAQLEAGEAKSGSGPQCRLSFFAGSWRLGGGIGLDLGL